MEDCSYVGKFECAVCQGVERHSDYCVLTCGHPFHVVCVETWLERSATCPSCRAKVSRRQIRSLTGIESVPDVAGASGDEAFQQRMARNEQQLEQLQLLLEEKQQQLENLSAAVTELSDREERLKTKLSDARRRSSALETAHLDDLQRLSNLSTEKQKLLEKYKTDVALLQHQLKDEQQEKQQAMAAAKAANVQLWRLQLSNPRLDVSALHALAQHEGIEQQSADAFAAALAQRNKELQDSRARIDQLQEQLRQQQDTTAKELEAARQRHEAEISRVEQDKQQHLKDALQLEYDNDKLKRDKNTLTQQLDELRSVLLALQGSNTAAPQQAVARGPQQQQQQQEHNSACLQENIPPPWQQQQYKTFHSLDKQIQQGSGKSCHVSGSDVVEVFDDDDGWVPQTEADEQLACSPRSSNSQLLDDMLAELTGADASQQQHDQHPTPHHSQQQMVPDQQQHQQGQPASSWQERSQAVLDVAAALGPGSLLRPGASAKQVPSFMAKSRVPHAGAVTGEFVRSGPDGRGSTATHIKPGSKRATHSVTSVGPGKKSRGGAKGTAKAGQTGIKSFFAKH